MPYYLDAIRHFQPRMIYAYPSAVYLLAEYVLRNRLQLGLGALRGVVTSSETLSAGQSSAIEKAFGCPVFDWYGLAERVVFIGTCGHGAYHLFEDYGYTELLPIDESRFQLVGTGFINNAMPLIRYRTGDVVELDEDQNCPCGSPFRKIKAIEGRMDDLVRLRDGTIIGRLDLIYKGLEGIREAQIVQNTYDDFTIRAILDDNCNCNTLDRLRDNLYSRLGNNVRLVIERVPAIERTTTGKFAAVISHVTRS